MSTGHFPFAKNAQIPILGPYPGFSPELSPRALPSSAFSSGFISHANLKFPKVGVGVEKASLGEGDEATARKYLKGWTPEFQISHKIGVTRRNLPFFRLKKFNIFV